MSFEYFHILLYIWIVIALLLFPIQRWWITAPYGRHTNKSWGVLMDNRLGWMSMELASPLCFAYFFLTGPSEKNEVLWLIFGLWILHYFNRSIIYPLRTRTSGKKIPLMIVLSAIFFNTVNGWSNGYYLGQWGGLYSEDWLWSFPFLLGSILFITGSWINISSDNYLLQLREPGETRYVIPKGGMFRYLSCPNHFGEILEWIGFAIMCWNIAALGFAIWTAANLIPRAMSHHQWYLKHFDDYPKDRKAVIPFLI